MLTDSEQRVWSRVLSRQEDAEPAAAFPDGALIGQWRVLALLGRGGSGEVYRVESVRTGQVAAAKVLVRSDAAALRRFDEEIHFLKAHQGSLFARFIESGSVGERPYLVMELLEPLDLPTGERAIADYLLSVCACVCALHRLGMVHRDLKPKNIMRRVDAAGRTVELVLIDFGLAKSTAAVPRNGLSTISWRIVGVGTPGYAAPEQMLGETVSPLADIHALGRIAHDAFGGKPPKRWAQIIRRATSSIPEQRYASVDEFAAAIRHRAHGRGWALAIALAGVLVAGAVGVFAWRGAGGAAPVIHEVVEEQKGWKALCAPISTNRVVKELLWEHAVTNRNPQTGYEHVVPAAESAYRLQTNAVEVTLVQLKGGENRFLHPIELEGGREYLVVGPGVLDGELVCRKGTATVGLKECILLNRMARPIEEAGIDYVLRGGAYLNFTRLDSPEMQEYAKHIRCDADSENNLVRFHGTETSKGLYRSTEAELWRQLSKDL